MQNQRETSCSVKDKSSSRSMQKKQIRNTQTKENPSTINEKCVDDFISDRDDDDQLFTPPKPKRLHKRIAKTRAYLLVTHNIFS